MQLKKEQHTEQTKNQLNLPENDLEAVKPYFGPQNMFNCTFIEHKYCIMWPLINENKQQLDKKVKIVKIILYLFFFFEKSLFPKT